MSFSEFDDVPSGSAVVSPYFSVELAGSFVVQAIVKPLDDVELFVTAVIWGAVVSRVKVYIFVARLPLVSLA